MTSTQDGSRTHRHLLSGIQSTVISTAGAAVGSVIRIPLTIAAIGAAGYGALSTICAVFGWMFFIAAGARNAGGAVAVSAHQADRDPLAAAGSVTRATLRHAVPVVALLIVLVAILPWHSLVDPEHTMSWLTLKVVLLASIAIGLASVPGAALLGVFTTRGRFRDQNAAILLGTGLTTALTAVAYLLGGGPGWFTVIWIACLALPALPIAFWYGGRLIAREGADSQDRTLRDVGSISGSSLWIAAGQQFASGFDLVIISVVIGSQAAAAYGLVSRLVQLALTPVIGAVPVLTQSAGRARVTGLPRARRDARSLTLLVAGLQCVGLVLFVVLGGWVSRLLSGGVIAVSTSLLAASAGWGVCETLRRSLMASSATPAGLRHWRRSNVAFAIPNLVLSVVFTKAVGVSGPMLGSITAVGAMVIVAAFSLREDLREALGR